MDKVKVRSDQRSAIYMYKFENQQKYRNSHLGVSGSLHNILRVLGSVLARAGDGVSLEAADLLALGLDLELAQELGHGLVLRMVLRTIFGKSEKLKSITTIELGTDLVDLDRDLSAPLEALPNDAVEVEVGGEGVAVRGVGVMRLHVVELVAVVAELVRLGSAQHDSIFLLPFLARHGGVEVHEEIFGVIRKHLAHAIDEEPLRPVLAALVHVAVIACRFGSVEVYSACV